MGHGEGVEVCFAGQGSRKTASLTSCYYIFSHPEFRDELGAVFDDILTNFSDEIPDPQRLAFEQGRRVRYAEERATLKGD